MTKMMTKGSALDLIKQSEETDSTVHSHWSLGKERDLFADCDDHAEVEGEEGTVQEFWGEGWRVHLHKQ